jgi:hypothetical protein
MATSTKSRGGKVGSSSTPTTRTWVTNSQKMWDLPKPGHRRYGDGLEVRGVPIRLRSRSATPSTSSTCPDVKERSEANRRLPDAHTTQVQSRPGRSFCFFRRPTYARRTTSGAARSATN